jgi:serine/threonine protein kinase
MSKEGSLTVTVAVKCLKATTDQGPSTDTLLREAALMALCDHNNLVHLIGVVTVPRNFPPLLVMEYVGTPLESPFVPQS